MALVLLITLSAVTMFGLSQWRSSESFTEAVWRFEDTLRLTRAEAAFTGRRVRIVFEPIGDIDQLAYAPRIQWEPDPLAEPGVFADYTATGWSDVVPGEELLILRSRLTGDSAYRTLLSEQLAGAEMADFEPVTFYPDGTSDSALFELADPDPETTVRIIVLLDGRNNTITRYDTFEGESEQYVEAALAGDSVQALHDELYPPEEIDLP